MSRYARTLALAALAVFSALMARGEGLTAVARVDAARSGLTTEGPSLVLTLALSQPVPWRAFTLADPPRLVVDFREVDWSSVDAGALLRTAGAAGLRTGMFRAGWSRLVVDLASPFQIETAVLQTGAADGSAHLRVRLDPVDAEGMRAASGAPPGALWEGTLQTPAPQPQGTGEVVVVLDPGHGGIDPGAERDGLREADLMLVFALELKEALVRSGRFRVALTRDSDVFVSLDGRISAARAAGADVMISLHADALAEGRATGATVYTLSEDASDEASRWLAERHGRADLLAGLDLTDQDDVIAGVLMDLARLDSAPRSAAVADAVIESLKTSVGGLHKRPRLAADFTVLRAPDFPSILLELGFISSDADRDRLTSPEWRAKAAQGIVQGLIAWAEADAARAVLLRQ